MSTETIAHLPPSYRNEEHRNRVLEYARQYRKKHLVELKQNMQCECGIIVIRENYSRHKYSKRHQTYMNKLKEARTTALPEQVAV